jgi:hypothetical protein
MDSGSETDPTMSHENGANGVRQDAQRKWDSLQAASEELLNETARGDIEGYTYADIIVRILVRAALSGNMRAVNWLCKLSKRESTRSVREAESEPQMAREEYARKLREAYGLPPS